MKRDVTLTLINEICVDGSINTALLKQTLFIIPDFKVSIPCTFMVKYNF
jgi:hypothetical protein